MSKYDIWIVRGGAHQNKLVPSVTYLPHSSNVLADLRAHFIFPSHNGEFVGDISSDQNHAIWRDDYSFVVALKRFDGELARVARERTAEKRALRRAYQLLNDLMNYPTDKLIGLWHFDKEIQVVIDMMRKCNFSLPGDEYDEYNV